MTDYSPVVLAFSLIPFFVYAAFFARGPRSHPWRDASNFLVGVLGLIMLAVSIIPLIGR